MLNQNVGSTWGKWDLHIHTPLSINQGYGGDKPENWEKFYADLEALPKEFKVLGINDYFTIEGYKRVKAYQDTGKLQGRVLFPVLEFRVKKFGNLGKDAWKRVNLHVIFDNCCDIKTIETQFINLLEIHYQEIYKKTGLNRENIEALGKAIKNSTPGGIKDNPSDFKVGFHNLNFDHRRLCELLKKNEIPHFIALGKTEWEALRWDASAADKRDVLNYSQFLFAASPRIESFNKGKDNLIKQGVAQTLIDCSDAHYYSTHQVEKKDKEGNTESSLINERIGNCFTWMKTSPTFEGLKQVFFAPDSRLKVSDKKPKPPARVLKSVKFNFPATTKISQNSNSTRNGLNSFCFEKNEINFSPYFTCLIGGRGSGKSTLLNLIAKSKGEESDFFDDNKLKDVAGDIVHIEDCIELDDSTDEIEFISQNKVENFAASGELTDAIYDRLKQRADYEEFSVLEEQLELEKVEIDTHIENINQQYEIGLEINKLRKLIVSDKKIIDSQADETYSEITKKIKEVSEQIIQVEKSKKTFEDLTKLLIAIREKYPIIVPQNEYDKANNEIVEGITTLIPTDESISKLEEQNNLPTLIQIKDNLRKELETYLAALGVNEEQINDHERASSSIAANQSKLMNFRVQIMELVSSASQLEKKEINKIKDEIEKNILIYLEPLNEKLKGINDNVADIRFEYEFDEEKSLNALFDSFYGKFAHLSENRTTKPTVHDYLFSTHPNNVDKIEDYKERLEGWGRQGGDVNAKKFIQKVFENPVNFEIYKLMIKKHLNDISSHKKIRGYYDSKDLLVCSFGQRCTAVIVAMIMFGTKPLLIDEPEAHLDSKLIAEYLVDLIKKKKNDRQIIFATHNANFVVNGDAELIHYLETDIHHKTQITPITIEDIDNRDLLLNLEGGREAFNLRQKKIIE